MNATGYGPPGDTAPAARNAARPGPGPAIIVHAGDTIAVQLAKHSGARVTIDRSDLSTRQHARISRQTPGAAAKLGL
jgi:hypothetical protein